jgi:putative ABC transport system permease protein
MESLLQDVRFAARSLRKARSVTAIAVACFALGIGANTAIFSVVKAVLVDAMPYRDPAHLVHVGESERGRGPYSFSPANFFDLQAQTDLFTGAAAYSVTSRDLVSAAEPQRLRGVRATANLFTVLGSQPRAGRVFLPSDTLPGQPPVVVLSEQLWRRQFGSDPAIVGATISLSGVQTVVVGVMPADFDFPITPVHSDFWLPLDWRTFGDLSQRMNHSLQGVVARLAPGLDSARAAAGLATLARRLATQFPHEQRERGFIATSIRGIAVKNVRGALLLLLGAAGLLLLIASANVANLLLARAAGRRREVAIRTALGAARGRLIRQLVTESALLALVGGAIGLGLAQALLRTLLAVAGTTLPRGDHVALDGSVLLFAALLSLATGAIFGALPAFRATCTDLRQDLSEAAGRSSGSAERHRLLSALIVGEIALSLMLLTGASLIVRSFLQLLDTNPGFDPTGVMTFRTNAPSGRGADSLRYAQFYGPVLDRVRAIPGVKSAGFTNLLPIQDGTTDSFIRVIGRPLETDALNRPDAEVRYVSSDYFRTLRIPIMRGRELTSGDDRAAPRVVIVNEELVKRFLPGENPIGKQLDPGNGEPATIIGVVHSVRQTGLDRPPSPELYLAAAQSPAALSAITYVFAGDGDQPALARAAREVVRSVAPMQPIYQLGTMDDVIAASLRVRRLVLMLLGGFAALAVLLSAAGVYGVTSYGVAQRTREIGIRMALGARGADVASMVLRDVSRVAGTGILIGILAAAVLSRLMQSLVFGVGVHDPMTFAAVPIVIGVVAIIAGVVPALRAAHVDPLAAMRAE